MRITFGLAGLIALATACADAQVISGTVRDPAGPVSGASVNLQYFPTAACKDLGSSSDKLTPAQDAELKGCMRQLPSIKTTANGTFETQGLKPGWYQLNFKIPLARKPSGNAPFGRYDGYVVIHTDGPAGSGTFMAVAVGTQPFELKAGTRAKRDFTYRP